MGVQTSAERVIERPNERKCRKRRAEFENSRNETARTIHDFRSRSHADVHGRQSQIMRSMQYMQYNKQMAEERERFIRDQRTLELQKERELLLRTPINWSYTLK